MDAGVAARIAKRFITLPLDKRKLYLEKMLAEGVSPANLPIPETRAELVHIPLSYAQQRQWFLWQLEPQSPAYNLSMALRLYGEFDAAVLERCLNQLVARHESLRTRFVSDQQHTVQVIAPALHVPVTLSEQACPQAERAALIKAFVNRQGQQLFDLATGPLLQVDLLRLADDDQVLVLTQHHIISDGVSLQILLKELIQLYAGAVQGQAPSLEPLPIQYADYAIWQRHWMEAGELERQLSYWKAHLGDEQPVLELPTDHPRPALQSLRGGQHSVQLDAGLSRGLQQLAQAENATLFMVLLAALQLLLQRYSGQHDIRIGVPMANRNRVETEGLIGFFVNTQVLRGQIDEQDDFLALLRQARASVLGAQAHQDLPFEQLVDALQPARSLSRNALFQVMFNHQREAAADRRTPGLSLPGLRLEGLQQDNPTAQFDLTLDTFEHEGGLSATFNYAADLFEASSIARMAGHWQRLLQAIVAAPQQRLGELAMLDPQERQTALQQGTAATPVAEADACVHQLIERQARRQPQQPAVLFEQQSLSFAALERQANALAHRLRAHGVGAECRVGIALERGPQLLVAVLAVLKAGAAYLPLDSSYPRERLAYMVKDSGLVLLLTQSRLLAQLPASDGVQTLVLDALDDSFADLADSAPAVHVEPDSLAYVIYTSGTTGQPKGVGVSHRALAMHCQAAARVYGLSAADCELQFASPSFDAAWEQMFMPLICGARIVLGDVGQWSAERLCEVVAEQQVTVLDLPPAYLLQQAAVLRQLQRTVQVRACILGGEGWDRHTLEALEVVRAEQLFNAYGPTEAVISPLIWRHDASDRFNGYAPIGQQVGQRSALILDNNLNVLPAGHVGDLYLGGVGLARGYLNRPGLTAQSFIPDPYASEPGGRLYRTGDLGSRRADGIVEYRGRSDEQVKIRGLRIELGEIQTRLQAAPHVREALVLAQPGPNGQQLVAYVVAQSTPVDPGQLRETLKQALKQDLPDYMVPAHLLFIEQLPLTSNGKLDRKALPLPDASQLQQAYVAPQSELEQRIAAIWQEVLKLERVGLTDNFFELGGDSIISIQVVSRARQAGIRFTPKELFQHQTVQGLASVAQLGEGGPLIDQRPASGTAELLPIQQVFFASDTPEPQHWNQSVLLKPASRLQVAVLQRALHALIEQHDALRLSFSQGAQGWSAAFKPAPAVEDVLWQVEADSLEAVEALGERAQRSLDLSEGPLLRALLINLADGEQRLLLVIHHLAVDGVSWRVLFEDLQSAYRQAQSGQTPTLPARTTSVQAWAEQLREYARSPALQAELGYWQGQLAGADGALPLDHPNGGRQNKLARSVHSQLDRDTTRRLLQQAPAAYRTQVNDLLLTALARVLTRWTGSDSLLVQLEGHGREELFDGVDLTRTVGWFTSMFPVRLRPAEGLGDSLKQIKEQLRAIPNKGLGYGALRYLGDDQAQAALSELTQAQVTFNYLGQFDGSFDDSAALFRPTGEARGLEQSPEALLSEVLSINGQVYDGQLSLGWTFSGEQFDSATIQRLADAYALELAALVEHCCQPQVHGVTPSDFPLARLDQAQLDSLPVPAAQLEDLYPLSPMQQGMLFHTLYEQGGGDYLNQMRLDIDGLDPQRFEQAWQAALDAQEILRTGFVWQGELQQPLQLVQRQVQVPFTVLDWRDHPQLPQALQSLAQSEYAKPFDMSVAPLLRLVLVRISASAYHLIYTNHHILLDGWSNSQLLGEVLQRYNGQAPAPRSGHYRDYIAWLQQRDAQATEQFWRAQLARVQEPTRLSRSIAREPGQHSGHGNHYQWLSAQRTQALGDFARARKVTVNTLLQAAWLLLLQRYTGLDCVCFGATVSGRPAELKGVEQQIGLFINTLPVIAQPRPELSVEQWLQQVQAYNLALREQEHTPLFDIQRWAGQGGEALFDNILVFENYPVAEALQQSAADDLRFGEIGNYEQTNYPLTLSVNLGQTMALHYSFNQADFAQASIERLARHLEALLDTMMHSPQQLLSQLDHLGAQERQQLLVAFNATATRYPLEQSIQQLIEAQVARTPQAPALLFGEQVLSYAQLNARANRLAHRLIEQGVGADVLVGIAAERSLEMVIGLLAVLKAGGAYVPLDPDYPQERLAYMFEDSGIALLLTQAPLREQLPLPAGLKVLLLEEALDGYTEDNPEVAVAAENLAYVIYTSGSTGKPKGAGNRHAALTNRLCWMQQAYGLDASDTVLQKTPFSFDVSVWEFFWPLMTGARLAIAGPGDHRDPARLVSLIQQHDVSTLHFVPSMLQAFLLDEQVGQCTGLKRIVCSGEALPVDAQQQVFAKLPQAGLYNLYGPTEAAIDVTHWTCRDEGADSVPIGEPIANLGTYVLSADLEPVAVGVIGELYLTGEGLARGYHRRPGLTAERFVASPFVAGQRLYRTGDLARQRPDGVIEYAGRIDHQVKIRGLRIELGEIEARLLELAEVREAVVVAANGPRGTRLVGYLVASTAQDESHLLAHITAQLAVNLPQYMVPAQWVVLAQMPLSPNGKLDRKALPDPQAGAGATEYVAPQTALEQALADIWAAVLELEQVSVNDNFFELGGDSIISIQVVSRARAAGMVLSPKDIFQQRTIAKLALLAEQAGKLQPAVPALPTAVALHALSAQQVAALDLDHERVSHLYRLSPMQQGMLFLSLNSDALYVNQLCLPIQGLDAERFKAAWIAVSQRHDALRTGFYWQDLDEPLQFVMEQLLLPIHELDWSQRSASSEQLQALADADRRLGFAMDRPPLQRLTLVRTGSNSHQLIWTYHHILLDGWSVSQLLAEVLAHYTGQALDPVVPYVDYIAWLQRQDPVASETFWRTQLAGLPAPTYLANAQPVREGGAGYQAIYSHFGAAHTQRFKDFAKDQQVTLNTLVQAAWLVLLSRYSGQQQVVFGATVAGRPVNLEHSQRMLGCFINTLPVIADVAAQAAVGDWLRELQDYNLGLRELEYTPLTDIQRWAGQPGQALFDTIIVFENHPVEQSLQRWSEESVSFGQSESAGLTNLPMDLMVTLEDGLVIEYAYLREFFDDAVADAIRQDMEGLLHALCVDAQQRLGNLGLPRGTARALPASVVQAHEPLVHQLIGDQVQRQGTRPAVSSGGRQLSFSQLDAQANRLARALIAQGVGAEVRVGIALPRSELTIVAMLAVLKAGGCYVPLDISHPAERLAYMMADSGMALLLCDSSLSPGLAVPVGVRQVLLDRLQFDGFSDAAPRVDIDPEHLAYVIYTSGSTGQPKGVAVAYGPLSAHCRAIGELYAMSADDCELHFMSFAFDGAQERWLTALSHGARLVVRDDALWTPEETYQQLHAQGVSVAAFPPVYLQHLADHAERVGNPPAVRIYCFGGDAVAEASFERVKRTLAPQAIFNGYGPTETVVTPLLWRAGPQQRCEAAYAPIGSLVGQRSAHVLDADLNPLPPGIAGELYLGGHGVARGYLDRPGLSAERFVADPFNAGGRLYRTGDLVRERTDGVFDYLGRIDHQVKIRGFRIELGEIEARLGEQDGVAEAVVVTHDSPLGKQLVAYLVASEPTAASGLCEQVRQALKATLPDYMVPAHLVLLERMPLSPNGKLERKALPAPQVASERQYLAPHSELQWALAEIWQAVLKVERVGLNDNFYEMGGDSILSLQVVARSRSLKKLGFSLKLRDLVQKPTIAELTASDTPKAAGLLSLNSDAPGKPTLFCVHAGFGTVFDYEPLARRLDSHCKVLAIPCRMLFDATWRDVSLAAMARDYVALVRQRQAHGPYHLLGWSLGGTLASLMAAEFERQGQTVAFLGLVDGYVPGGAEALQADNWQGDLQDFLDLLSPGLSQQLPALAPAEAEVDFQAVFQQLLAPLPTAQVQASRYLAMGPEELANLFVVARRLMGLSRALPACAVVQVPAHAWWTPGRQDERDALASQLGQPRLASQTIACGHFQIPRDERLLQALQQALEETQAVLLID
ncbi:amino acid adenylation domain-containing protein [Pseudomonas tructae]|uniref:Amino acid adenylation domain-containing protein n=1 Tax=Pseudomonas tructae TaxID=2518644 RepID=A0A411ML30_9PSED|nr:non-ribosomal peptide synthetase [Pseudomonas tructae]QBF27505.1 amino acid adenylation domain-containing protein [Pseudomonas tructae]